MKDVLPMRSLTQSFFHRELNNVNAGMRSRLYNHDTLDFRIPKEMLKVITDKKL
jgi:hypothetical protein